MRKYWQKIWQRTTGSSGRPTILTNHLKSSTRGLMSALTKKPQQASPSQREYSSASPTALSQKQGNFRKTVRPGAPSQIRKIPGRHSRRTVSRRRPTCGSGNRPPNKGDNTRVQQTMSRIFSWRLPIWNRPQQRIFLLSPT